MIERALLTPDELKSFPKGTFVVMKTGFYPMQVRLKLFFKWRISFDQELYVVPDKGNRKVSYANKGGLEEQIVARYAVSDTSSVGEKMTEEEAAARAEHQSAKANSEKTRTSQIDWSKDDDDKANDSDSEDKGDSMPIAQSNIPAREEKDIVFNEKGVIVDETVRSDLPR